MKKEFPVPFEGVLEQPTKNTEEERAHPSVQEDFFRSSKMGKPIAKRIKSLEEQPGSNISSEPIPQGIEAVKHEAYALGAHLIGVYHSHVKKSLAEHPEELLEELQPLETLPHGLKIFSQDEKGNLVVNHEHIKLLPQKLFSYHWSNNLFPKIYNNLFQKSFSTAKQNFSERDQAIYKRLEEVLVQEKFRRHLNKGIEFGLSPETFLGRGVNTATFESWGILISSISRYQEHFGQKLTTEVLEKVTPALKQILTRVSSLHLADFVTFSRLGNSSGPHGSPLGDVWNRMLLYSGSATDPKVEINPQFLQEWRASTADEYKEWQQGCPARDVRVEGSDGKKVSMIADVFDFYKDLAERVVLPHQELLLKSKKS